SRLALAEQIKLVVGNGSSKGTSRQQQRLTLLVEHKGLDTLPRKPSEPAIYLLSRKSTLGNRLMKEKYSEVEFRSRMTGFSNPAHLIDCNWVRAIITRGVKDLGWQLKLWLTSRQLASLLASAQLEPDGYCQVVRSVDGAPKTSGFF